MILLKKIYFVFKNAVMIARRRILQNKYFKKLKENTIMKNVKRIQEFSEIRIYSLKQRILKILRIMPKLTNFQKFIQKKRKSICFQVLVFNYEEGKVRNENLDNLVKKWAKLKDQKWVIVTFH